MMKTALSSQYQYNAETNTWARPGQSASFGYSDGDQTENHIFRVIRGAKDKSVTSGELQDAIRDWATLYHLSSERANVLRPIADRLEGPILEIGSGCGAISRFLGEQGFDVVAVEGSPRRAAIGAARCQDLPNVNFVADPFQNFDIGQKFKTITLIGVLEYARMFYDRSSIEDPIDMMLKKVTSLLEPDGVLVIAIENQIGLKYFAGFPEDHIGQPMAGIESRYTATSAVTFGKKELGERMANVGLDKHEWWYPFPDYKLPVSVLSDEALKDEVPADFTSMISGACATDKQAPRLPYFSMDFAWKAIVRNNLVDELANSFVLMASAKDIAKPTAIGFHYGGPRDPAFKKTVEFGKEESGYYVERRKTYPDAVAKSSEARHFKLALGREPLYAGLTWREELRYIMMKDGWTADETGVWVKVWWDAFKKQVSNGDASARIEHRTLVSGVHLDASPRNLLVAADGSTNFIDQEWCREGEVEAGYILFRSLYDAILGVSSCGNPAADTPREVGALLLSMARYLGLSMNEDDVMRYFAEEYRFQSAVHGKQISGNLAVLGKKLPPRITPVSMMMQLERALKTRDEELKQIAEATDQMRTKVSEFNRSLEAKLGEAHRQLREKDEQIATLLGQRSGAA
ncbi:class I SAM-dependent methyltransferase [Neorhizobium alkalisoli]|nr:class I SAM-dependent methyltransferase [Neorhizobium alkalisoli]